jgi:glycosyltransferase A (GT-A) superfamily protein (DUF2064 family)
MRGVALVVIAKAPAAGRSKTRLCSPCTPEQAAALAEASLRDTIAAIAAAPARRRVVALEGEPDGWLRPGFELHRQRGNGLAERLGEALVAAGGPALVVGMDTPQLSAPLLQEAARRLTAPGVDAVLGPAVDGGYWTIGLRGPDRSVFSGVPMSRADTSWRKGAAWTRSACARPCCRHYATWTRSRMRRRWHARPRTEFAAALRRLGTLPS